MSIFKERVTNPISFKYRNREFDVYTTPEILDDVCKFQFLPTDILLSTSPRCGTTFTQEVMWQIENRKTTVKDEKVDLPLIRVPFLEFNYNLLNLESKSAFEVLEKQKSDPYRLIKSHVPYEFIKDNFEKVNPKMIVVMRNAKDFLVSYYLFEKNNPIDNFSKSFDEFFQLFLTGELSCGCYFDKNLEWWTLRHQDNILIVFYEDLLMNLPSNVEKIAKFLEDELTQDELDKIVHNCSFSTMSKNPKINLKFNDEFSFLRKGIVGDWKNHLTEEQNKILNDKIENTFRKVGLNFIYE